MIDLKKIRELIKLMVANELTELDLEGDGERVTLKRSHGEPGLSHGRGSVPGPAGGGAGPAPIVSSMSVNADGPADSGQPQTGQDQEASKTITSPMVGTFYSAPSPDAKPFVSIGDRVNSDTVVCIIEAMKVFNEIKAERAGVIEKVLVDNGQAVEFDHPLFSVRSD